MGIHEFSKNYFLDFVIDDNKKEQIEFELVTVDRNTLQPTVSYKKLKTETPTDWFQEKIGEEILAGRHPEKFINSFYENTKRKLINTHLIKYNIKGLDAMNAQQSLDFLFQ
ncbi:hypothetical protein [Ochrovirga pacifica]|uniref:hypothetical protein n=1 Tax=Ochrovirga pacifica TaxID=1042376 RepID=UPI000255A025|nr:hypothetical protein [Ochrovirga pacifica]